MGCARSQHSRGGVRGARSDEGTMMREIPFFSERDYLMRWVKYHSREWETLASLGWTTAYIGAGPRSKDALMIKPKTRTDGKRNPARRRAKSRRHSERGFFPRKPVKGLRDFPINLKPTKAEMRDVVSRLTRQRNPATHIKKASTRIGTRVYT